jgi:lipopolysaccharide transport system ATP-binding protein
LNELAIRVDAVGKRYHIGALQAQGSAYRYKSLRDAIASLATFPLQAVLDFVARRQPWVAPPKAHIWALRNVSFDVRPGDIVGIVGRNGAGKSTLLKILAQITEPSTGRIEIRGRTGSLLEVGSGFHPELTGRDNVFLNGIILGMRRAEIARQFDAIVAFAEVEKFIDTPVKHYSSGMYLRLAFSVAAHLQTEILLVDEVLAVGDYRFQEKCLGKMQDVAASGRTVLCVSHSMSVIQRLCNRAIALEAGEMIADAKPDAVIAEYLSGSLGSTFADAPSPMRPTITLASLRVQDNSIRLSAEFQSPFAISCPVFGFVMYNSIGTSLFGSDSGSGVPAATRQATTCGRFEVDIAVCNLRPDRYFFTIWLSDPYVDYCTRQMALHIDLHGGPGTGSLTHYYGSLLLQTEWHFEPR